MSLLNRSVQKLNNEKQFMGKPSQNFALAGVLCLNYLWHKNCLHSLKARLLMQKFV